jgi:DNA-binding MarR family transcriptional regulator
MKESVFDPAFQTNNTDAKILAALHALSESMRANIWVQSQAMGLSPIQIQILTYISFHPQLSPTITSLAKEFGLTKATLSDSIRVLENKGLVSKEAHPRDSRSSYIALTEAGKTIAEEAAQFANGLLDTLTPINKHIKANLLEGLLTFIKQLQATDHIAPQRMCFNCRFYSKPSVGHYCLLLNQPLGNGELRFNCPEFQVKY